MIPKSSSARSWRLVPVALILLTALTGCGEETAGPEPEPEPAPASSAPAAQSEPTPPPPGDEIGMARALGPATWARCADHLSNPGAKVYELSHVISNTMPLSPFAGPFEMTFLPPASLPGTSQVYNVDVMNENAMIGQQGTQIDALGHFGRLPETWDGSSELPVDGALYYGGFTQSEVKPTADSPLLKLGMEKMPPVITTAVLLDARKHVKGGEAMTAGELVTAEHIEQILEAEGLSERGILPGDVVYIYTGWSDHYQDPAGDSVYYTMGPGLSFEGAKYLGARGVVAVGLDAPFFDGIAEGQFAGTAGPPEGTPPGKALPSHEHMLTEAGVHSMENLKLDELARDGVTTSCGIILPLRQKGSSGSPIRPVAIGAAGS